jgi:hypothetical protein
MIDLDWNLALKYRATPPYLAELKREHDCSNPIAFREWLHTYMGQKWGKKLGTTLLCQLTFTAGWLERDEAALAFVYDQVPIDLTELPVEYRWPARGLIAAVVWGLKNTLQQVLELQPETLAAAANNAYGQGMGGQESPPTANGEFM